MPPSAAFQAVGDAHEHGVERRGFFGDGDHFDDIAVRYKGNGTFIDARASGKFSFKLDLNKFVKGQRLAGVKTINLHNAINDPGWMNEPIAYRLYREAQVPASRTSYARVFIDVPERGIRRYAGLYVLVENVDEEFIADRFEEDAGALLKPVPPELFDDLGDDWSAYQQAYDPKTDLTHEQQQRVIQFSRLVTHAGDAEFATRLGEFLDIESFARYMAVLVWLGNTDSLLSTGQNYYLYLDPHTQRFVFIPWDQDASFGQFAPVGQRSLIGLRILHPWQGPNRFLERVFDVSGFRSRYLATLEHLADSVLRPERIVADVEARAVVLRPLVREEPRDGAIAAFEQVVAGNAFRHPTLGTSMLPIRTFVQARARSVTAQLEQVHY